MFVISVIPRLVMRAELGSDCSSSRSLHTYYLDTIFRDHVAQVCNLKHANITNALGFRLYP